MASKGIVADLNKGEKLDGENYNIWHCKIQYVLNEQEVLETQTHSLSKPDEGSTEQHLRDLAAYESWLKKDLCARFTMLSSMHNDLSGEFEQYTIAQDAWKALKLRYEGTSTTRLCGLTMKFDSYKMRSKTYDKAASQDDVLYDLRAQISWKQSYQQTTSPGSDLFTTKFIGDDVLKLDT